MPEQHNSIWNKVGPHALGIGASIISVSVFWLVLTYLNDINKLEKLTTDETVEIIYDMPSDNLVVNGLHRPVHEYGLAPTEMRKFVCDNGSSNTIKTFLEPGTTVVYKVINDEIVLTSQCLVESIQQEKPK